MTNLNKIEKHDNPKALLLRDLSLFQRNMEGAKRDAKNPFHRHAYADLSSVVKAIKDFSNDLNLGYYHSIDHDSNILTTTLFYSDGVNYAEILSSLNIDVAGGKNPMQAKGAAITYAKRYTLQGLYGLPSEDDDAQSCDNTRFNNRASQVQPQAQPISVSKTYKKERTLEEISGEISEAKSYDDLKVIYNRYQSRSDAEKIQNLCAQRKGEIEIDKDFQVVKQSNINELKKTEK